MEQSDLAKSEHYSATQDCIVPFYWRMPLFEEALVKGAARVVSFGLNPMMLSEPPDSSCHDYFLPQGGHHGQAGSFQHPQVHRMDQLKWKLPCLSWCFLPRGLVPTQV